MINGTRENVGRLLSSGRQYVYTYLPALLVASRYISGGQKTSEDKAPNNEKCFAEENRACFTRSTLCSDNAAAAALIECCIISRIMQHNGNIKAS